MCNVIIGEEVRLKLTKEIVDLIEKRRKYGTLANHYDSKVQKWCEMHGVDCTAMIIDYGCMLTSEPDNYAVLTLKLIEEIK
jgi:hypothetical protein